MLFWCWFIVFNNIFFFRPLFFLFFFCRVGWGGAARITSILSFRSHGRPPFGFGSTVAGHLFFANQLQPHVGHQYRWHCSRHSTILHRGAACQCTIGINAAAQWVEMLPHLSTLSSLAVEILFLHFQRQRGLAGILQSPTHMLLYHLFCSGVASPVY